jgi:hypothetical protein
MQLTSITTSNIAHVRQHKQCYVHNGREADNAGVHHQCCHPDTHMTIRLTKDGTAVVDTDYYWQPIATCPRSAKVQLLSVHGVAVYGELRGDDKQWTHWAPLPKKPKEESK